MAWYKRDWDSLTGVLDVDRISDLQDDSTTEKFLEAMAVWDSDKHTGFEENLASLITKYIEQTEDDPDAIFGPDKFAHAEHGFKQFKEVVRHYTDPANYFLKYAVVGEGAAFGFAANSLRPTPLAQVKSEIGDTFFAAQAEAMFDDAVEKLRRHKFEPVARYEYGDVGVGKASVSVAVEPDFPTTTESGLKVPMVVVVIEVLVEKEKVKQHNATLLKTLAAENMKLPYWRSGKFVVVCREGVRNYATHFVRKDKEAVEGVVRRGKAHLYTHDDNDDDSASAFRKLLQDVDVPGVHKADPANQGVKPGK